MFSSCDPVSRRRALFRYLGIAGGTAVAVLAGAMPVTAAAASTATPGGGWSWPRELPAPPGFAAGGDVTALSCASRSDCTAAGNYEDPPEGNMFFAVTERRGVWGKGVGIAAPAALKKASFEPPVLSCASAGNCAAGVSYYAGIQQGTVVVSETNGTWGKARKVRTATGISALSCPAPGDCTAALTGGYLLNERRGTWRQAFGVPGLAALHGQFISLGPISCSSPGNCTATGNYDNNGDRSFVVTEGHGLWGDAQPITSSQGAWLVLYALSCPSAGNCVAGGYIYPLTGPSGAFAVTETHGTWGTAVTLPGTTKLAGGIDQLDCPAAGTCSAVGSFLHGDHALEPFVSAEKNGTWHTAQTITGAGATTGTAFDTLACAAAGTCVLAGAIVPRSQAQAASAAQENYRWGPAGILRGIRALDHGQASAIEAVSCPPRSQCAAVGAFGPMTEGMPIYGHLFVTVQR
jgi:hypothetical protein